MRCGGPPLEVARQFTAHHSSFNITLALFKPPSAGKLRRPCLPSWTRLLTLIAFAFPHSLDPNRRLLWWLLPPILLLLALFGGRWLYAAAHAHAEGERQAAERAAAARIERDETARAAAVLAQKRETLEVLGLGLVVEKFRNAQVWEAIQKVERDPFASILPTEPEVVAGELVRGQRTGKRASDTHEYAMRYFVEKIPLPGIVIFPKPTGKDPELWESGAGTLMNSRGAFTLFITAEQIYADDPDEALGKIFEFFDAHPDVPAVYVITGDGYMIHKRLMDPSPSDINGDPGWKPGDPTEAMAAFVLVRRDRVNRLIRPFAVDEAFGLDYDDQTSYVNRVWNFFFSLKKRHADSALPTVAEWLAEVPTLMEAGRHVPVSSLMPFWERRSGFVPSPWIPVPWTKWQLKEFDELPTLGYLHRPQYASYRQADGQPLGERHRPAAFAAAWRAALDTLPAGRTPVRLFFDAGGVSIRGRGIPPMANAFATHHPDTDWDLGSPRMIDLSARLDDTGAASPFVQIALAVIASYRDGDVSATVNLRRAEGASILMVSPPSAPPEARKPHPGAGQDPFKVPLAPAFP
ncbi:MAG: DUF2875 family protein [Propionivibrio sp.]